MIVNGMPAAPSSAAQEPSAEALSTTVIRTVTASAATAAKDCRHSLSCAPEFQLTITTWREGRSIVSGRHKEGQLPVAGDGPSGQIAIWPGPRYLKALGSMPG